MVLNEEKGVNMPMKRNVAIFTGLSIVLFSLCLLGCQHGASNAAVACKERGDAYYQKGQLDQAIEAYTEAVRMNPQYDKAYCNRGFVYAEKGQYHQAIADYTAALRNNPKYALAYFDKGLAYKKLGRKSEAIEAYRQFLRYASSKESQRIEQAKQEISVLGG